MKNLIKSKIVAIVITLTVVTSLISIEIYARTNTLTQTINPQTGDYSNIWIFAAIALISVIGIIAIIIAKRNR